MSETKTFFEQIPVETVKKICEGKIGRTKKEIASDNVAVQPPAGGIDLPSGKQPMS